MILQIEKMNNNNKDLIAAVLSRINNTVINIKNLSCSNPNHDRYSQIRARNLHCSLIKADKCE